MNQAIELTLEQEFSLRCFADQVQQMSHEQAHEFLIEQHRLMMLQETMYQNLLKHEWKLDGDLAPPKQKTKRYASQLIEFL